LRFELGQETLLVLGDFDATNRTESDRGPIGGITAIATGNVMARQEDDVACVRQANDTGQCVDCRMVFNAVGFVRFPSSEIEIEKKNTREGKFNRNTKDKLTKTI
jgi:hypothetical protein